VFDTHIPKVASAVAAFGANKLTHAEILKTYIPETLAPFAVNSYARQAAFPFSAAVFNMERGTYLSQIIAYFKHHPMLRRADVVFANELDWGMARTHNADIAGEFARALSFNYVYGVEFVSAAAGKDGNGRGLHGNAIFSRFALEDAKVIHLPIQYEWFYKEGDCRLGMRNAVLAVADTPQGKIGLVSAHLENRAVPHARKAQMEFLLDQIDTHFGASMPVLLGGDMNTNTVDGNNDEEMRALCDDAAEMWRRIGDVPAFEPLLDYAASRGFSYACCNLMAKTTRRKPLEDGRTAALNLDWFFERGLRCSSPAKVESVFHKNGLVDAGDEVLRFQGQEMSDHDMVMVSCEGIS
jgi:endonuclease/exonuclease/phosphatase family metal-dependent hydrolase